MPNEPLHNPPVKRKSHPNEGRKVRSRYPGSTSKHPKAAGKPGVRRRKKR